MTKRQVSNNILNPVKYWTWVEKSLWNIVTTPLSTIEPGDQYYIKWQHKILIPGSIYCSHNVRFLFVLGEGVQNIIAEVFKPLWFLLLLYTGLLLPRVIFIVFHLQKVLPHEIYLDTVVFKERIWDIGIHPFLISPTDNRAKGAKMKLGQIFPCIQ